MQFVLDEITYVSMEWDRSHEVIWKNFKSTYEIIRQSNSLNAHNDVEQQES